MGKADSSTPEAGRQGTEKVIVALGEALWDLFPDGPRFGGAPANFACMAAQLGRGRCRVYMVSSVGDDELGRRAIEELQKRGVDTTHVSRSSKPTGTVKVTVGKDGEPSYEITDDVAWDHIEWTPALAELAVRTDAVCFGSLAQRSPVSRETLQRYVESTGALKVFDVNVRQPHTRDDVLVWGRGRADVLKFNAVEARQVIGDGAPSIMAVTGGARGASIRRDGEFVSCGAVACEVVNTVGAGDAYAAALVHGLLADDDLATINRRACEIASYVCTQPGATPELPERLAWWVEEKP